MLQDFHITGGIPQTFPRLLAALRARAPPAWPPCSRRWARPPDLAQASPSPKARVALPGISLVMA